MKFKFEELDVYQKAVSFAGQMYVQTKTFPKDELFGLISQLRRAAVSISLNIAEGSARSKKDFARFLDMSRGSVYECVTVLKICRDQKYIGEQQFEGYEDSLVIISKMLSGLKRSLLVNSTPRTTNYQPRT
ncbi:MAG: four helix bundle protein [Phycisphaerae bacterium]|nr:four helix bundle protein [Phycisphaerae bacterium]